MAMVKICREHGKGRYMQRSRGKLWQGVGWLGAARRQPADQLNRADEAAAGWRSVQRPASGTPSAACRRIR